MYSDRTIEDKKPAEYTSIPISSIESFFNAIPMMNVDINIKHALMMLEKR
jgi:hypothetical protein